MFNAGYLQSKPGIARIGPLVFGIIVMGVGCHSHFQSNWGRNWDYFKYYCHTFGNDLNCPDIQLERYFIGITITCFIVSLIFFVAIILLDDFEKKPYKQLDAAFHILAGLLILIAAGMYIYSAVQINDIIKTDDAIPLKGDFFYTEKIAAGVLGIINSGLYCAAGWIIWTSKSDIFRKY